MRKVQKEQIKQIVALLEQVPKAFAEKNHIENKENIIGMLQECQEAAIAIGTFLEKTEGEDNSVISRLEEYCEMLYQYSGNMSKENLGKIEVALAEVKSAIESISVKKIVCFLPYKASMWDSLESVWKAADEDPNCDAYVIPIPYYDRKSDGSFGEMHYEGDLYPDYVPITSYEKFDLEETRPEQIFIHNPYDDYNLVTSVHPMFYSKKLKDYTEQLIYIPYFILGEVDPEDDEAVEKMEHFCKTPAVINAHKVIVQSEQMKQVYVKVMTEWQGERTRSYWEKKILGLGSPKLDKVANTKKEDIEIPRDWYKFIQKSNGEWKKIIFYNTSIAAFLEHSEEMLEKIENVFEVFKENKEGVALLWRPHPLMFSTIESMRPELLERYQKIVNRYKEEKIGIYDDTPNLDRAIALADAYFGDPSSVVPLCQEAGMPVMIQNVEISYEERTN